jgi:hypothetical protein
MANHPLTVYLRGHHAGGHTAIQRLREQAASDPAIDRRTFLSALAAEIDADLSTLQDVMARLGVRPSPLRNAAASTAAVLGRWFLRAERPGEVQAILIGLESLSLGIEGKAKLWRTLGEVSVTEPRLSGIDFAGLSERACSQRERLEPYRLAAALEAEGGSSATRA